MTVGCASTAASPSPALVITATDSAITRMLFLLTLLFFIIRSWLMSGTPESDWLSPNHVLLSLLQGRLEKHKSSLLGSTVRRALLPIVTHKVVNSQAWGKCSRCQAVKTTAITRQMSSTVSSCLENDGLKEKYLESMWKFDLGWLICREIKGMSTKNVEWKITSKQEEIQLKNKKTIQSKSRQRT